MKHLSSDTFAALADGQAPSRGATAHLALCRACSLELKEWRALVADLQGGLPAPDPALRQATLLRLGLAPRPQTRLRAWFWAPALAGALVLAVFLPRAWSPPQSGSVPQALPHAAGPPAVPPPQVHAKPVHTLDRQERPAPVAEPELAFRPALPVQRSELINGSVVGASVGSAPPGVGLAPASKNPAPDAVGLVDAVEPKFVPTPLPRVLRIISVRNNLLKPGSGADLSLSLELPAAGPVKALVLDSRGRTVDVLYDAVAGPEPLQIRWDGGSAPSGAYTILVLAQGSSLSQKALLVR